MSKQSFFRFTGMVLVFFLTTNVFGQNSSGNSVTLDKNTMEAFAERTASDIMFAEAAAKLAGISKKMAKNFTKSYSNARNINISTGEADFTFVSCYIDGIRNRIAYDKKGHLHSKLRFYTEDELPRDVRHLVKSNYYDFSIAGVTEVSYSGKLAHVINLESKTEWKKLKVVDAIAKELELKNVTSQHIRAEELKNKKFDFAVSRAVASLKDLWKWSKPLLRHKGQGAKIKNPETRIQSPGLICLKGGDLAKEIQESNTTPRLIEISEIFSEEYFKEKYLLYIPRG